MYDQARALKVIRFFENVLRHPTANLSPFLLAKWQRGILKTIYGNVDDEGARIIRRVFLEIAKKNGKSEFAAGIALFMLLLDGESACEVYSAATMKKQAALVFNTAAAMVTASPALRRELRIIRSSKTIIKRNDPSSFYRVVSADGDAEDGMNPSCVIIDELHRWKNSAALALYEVLTRSGMSRRQPLVLEITTAGSTEDESPLWAQERELTQLIEKGIVKNRQFYGKLFALTESDDWTDEANWSKANPSLETADPRGFLKIKVLRALYDEAIAQPRKQPAFKRFHLGIPGSTEAEWMPLDAWDQNGGELRGVVERPCYLGLDLSSTTDLTSLVALFPDGDGTFDVMPFYFMPSERVEEREQGDRMPYRQWIDDELMESIPGPVIDLAYIKKTIKWCMEVFDVKCLAFDPAHALQLSIDLDKDLGLECVPVPMRFSHMSEPMKRVMDWTLEKRLRHAMHPILRWNMRCTRAKADTEDNIRPVKPDRRKDSKRIDGTVALILAASRAMFHTRSVYDSRGISST